MPRKSRHRDVMVYVSSADVIDELSDDDLMEELKARGKMPAEYGIEIDIVRMAYDELKIGRSASALALLDRLLFPTKFADPKVSLFPEWRVPS